jgi:hypothetical protein
MVCGTCAHCTPPVLRRLSVRTAYTAHCTPPVLRRLKPALNPAGPPAMPPAGAARAAERPGRGRSERRRSRPGGQPHCTNPRLHQLPDTHGATADRGQQSTDHRPARARAWAHPSVERTQPTRPLALKERNLDPELKERDLDPEQPACELGGRPGRRLGRLGAVSKRL